MKFFIAKLTYVNGDVSHPLSLFSEDITTAIALLKDRLESGDVTQVIIRQRPLAEAAVIYSRSEQGPAITEHRDINWDPEP